VRHDTPETIYAQLQALAGPADPRLALTFPVELPASGFTKVQAEREVAPEPAPGIGHLFSCQMKLASSPMAASTISFIKHAE
jgi:hypothetical protein